MSRTERTTRGRTCVHPHKHRPEGEDWSVISLDPCEPTILRLLTDAGWKQAGGVADNLRGRAAQIRLGGRHVEARTAVDFRIEAGRDQPSLRQSLLLSMALAENEGRYCVSDWCRDKLSCVPPAGDGPPVVTDVRRGTSP